MKARCVKLDGSWTTKQMSFNSIWRSTRLFPNYIFSEQIKTANLKRELEALRKLNGETEKTLNITKEALENSEERYERESLNLCQKTREAKQLAENVKSLTKENDVLSDKVKGIFFQVAELLIDFKFYMLN